LGLSLKRPVWADAIDDGFDAFEFEYYNDKISREKVKLSGH
jgi:hypothetical protein